MSEQTILSRTTSTVGSILRWLVLLPAVIISVALVRLPVGFFVWYCLRFPDLVYDTNTGLPVRLMSPHTIEQFVHAFVNPFVFIYVGVIIAPRLKMPTAIALAVLWGVCLGVLAVLFDERYSFLYFSNTLRWLGLLSYIVLQIAGISAALLITYCKHVLS